MSRIDGKNVINKLQYQQQINNKRKNKEVGFDKLLEQKANSLEKELKFSKHAMERINSRNLELNEVDIEKISQAMNKAEEKGINNSLIVTDKAVYIANIKSRTIITAMEGMKDRVFTNVDGVINI
ncbi:MAG: TIGR02530 family flagellar biosynthesis protein [Clostridia bacterium]